MPSDVICVGLISQAGAEGSGSSARQHHRLAMRSSHDSDHALAEPDTAAKFSSNAQGSEAELARSSFEDIEEEEEGEKEGEEEEGEGEGEQEEEEGEEEGEEQEEDEDEEDDDHLHVMAPAMSASSDEGDWSEPRAHGRSHRHRLKTLEHVQGAEDPHIEDSHIALLSALDALAASKHTLATNQDGGDL